MSDTHHSMRFVSKVIIVTGAGSGIGEGAARRFAAEGASVVLAGRTHAKLDRVAHDLAPARTLVYPFDASKYQEAQQPIEATVSRFGRIDVLVNNAGVAPTGRIDEASLDDWRAVMSTDLDGVFYCSRAAARHLIDAQGSIVNVSSVSGLGGDWGLSFYNAAKGAVTNFTRALALDLGRDGVRVNAVCPSLTETDLTQTCSATRPNCGTRDIIVQCILLPGLRAPGYLRGDHIGGFAAGAAGIAKILFVIFLIVFVVTLVMGLMRR